VKGKSPALPRARTKQLLARELPDGLVVYDMARHHAHSLNRSAALVWRRCDGKTSIREIARLLHTELSLPEDEEFVWLALTRLDKAGLMEDRTASSAGAVVRSRRAVLRKLGLSGGLALLAPVVTSIAAPRPVFAQSGSTGETTGTTTTGSTTTGSTTTGNTTTGNTTTGNTTTGSTTTGNSTTSTTGGMSCIPFDHPCDGGTPCCPAEGAVITCKPKNGINVCC
jgi:hypothetical protein